MKKTKNNVLNNVHAIHAILFVAICAIMMFASEEALAQSSGLSKAKSALSTTTTEISGLFDTVYKLCLAVAAICAIIAGIIIYNKWGSGDPNATKLVAAWFGAGLFILAVGVFVKAMFL
jgi:hypothetical protein